MSNANRREQTPERHEGASERAPMRDAGSRPPGRSFDDPRKPLGEDTLARSPDIGAPLEEGVYGRSEGEPHGMGVADRAKVVAVLRKAEEFMRSANPAPTDEWGLRRALELAAGRIGLTLREYDRIVKADPELQELERKVLEDNAGRH